MSKFFNNQRGVVPVLLLLTVIGLLLVLGITSYAPFRDQLLSQLFKKDPSQAASDPISGPVSNYTGTLSLDPATGTFNRGCFYSILVRFDTGGKTTDGIDASIFYDNSKMAVNSFINGTAFSDYPASGASSNEIYISGITPAPPTPGVAGQGILSTIVIQIPQNAPLGTATLNFDFDPNNKTKTTDSNIAERGTAVDVLNSVTNGNYQIGAGSCFPKNGDINNDSKVNVLDLSILLSNWHQNHPPADLNNDGIVNLFDFSIMLTNWTSK